MYTVDAVSVQKNFLVGGVGLMNFIKIFFTLTHWGDGE